MSLVDILGIVSVILIGLKLWNKVTAGKCRSSRQMNGKTVIITGANSGIGQITSLDLARRGARVILACRNQQLGERAIEDIRKHTTKGELVLKHLDLSKQSSIRQFAEEINREESRLDVLINNAGIGGVKPRKLTEDGVELTFAINYFGPFLLTHLLLDKIKASAPSRIINVSSLMHWCGSINFDNFNEECNYSPTTVYSDTKLALNIFTHELADRLKGTDVTVNSLHPGAVNTEIFRRMPKFLRWLTRGTLWLFFKSPEEGAETTIYLATSEDVENVTGTYFSDCRIARESRRSLDKETATKLWTLSKKTTKLD